MQGSPGTRSSRKQPGELAALGAVLRGWLGRGAQVRHGRDNAGEPPDRMQHLAAIAEHNAEVFQILVCQVSEDGESNAFSAKRSPYSEMPSDAIRIAARPALPDARQRTAERREGYSAATFACFLPRGCGAL